MLPGTVARGVGNLLEYGIMCMDNQMEIWKPVAGFEGFYEVSDRGRVRGLDRYVPINGGVKLVLGKILKLRKIKPGAGWRRYPHVQLTKDNTSIFLRVPTLVLTTFIGPRPVNLLGLHRDDNPLNNVLSNLYWGTRSNNACDSLRNKPELREVRRRSRITSSGGDPDRILKPVVQCARRGNYRAWNRALTETDAKRVIKLAADGMIPSRIAEQYPQVSFFAIWRICEGRTWKHLPRD